MSDDFPSLYTPSATAGPSTSSGSATAGSSSAAQALEQLHEQTEASSSANGQQNGQKQAQQQLDFASESSFPSLGAPSAAIGKAAAGGWGGAARSRAAHASSQQQHQQQASSALYTETLVLPSSSINLSAVSGGSGAQRGPSINDATTLGGVLTYLMGKYPSVKVEASSSAAKQTTTFLFKAARQQDVERVKHELRTRIVRKVNETIQVPSSTRAFIIGSKGKTLKSIIDETGVNIQIPRDQAAAPVDNGEPTYEGDEPEDPPVSINLYGDAGSLALAKQRILAIVNERTSRLSTKVSTIPTDFYHLLSAKVARNEIVPEMDANDVNISIPPVWKFRSGAGRGASASAGEDVDEQKEGRDNSITVSGDRDAVNRAMEALTNAADELKRTTQTLSVTLSKRQHRFILPPASDEILRATSCSVEVPPSSSSSDQITIRGSSTQIVEALQMVMQKANAAAVDVVDLGSVHGINTPSTYAKQCARYLLSKAKLRKIADEETVQIYIPRPADEHTTIDIVATAGPKGPAAAVSAARSKVLDVLKTLPPSVFDTVEIDQLLHRFLIGRKGAKIQTFEEKNKVQVVFPPAAVGEGEDKQITLIYVGSDLSSAPRTLSEVKEEILKLAKEAADISTSTLTIPAKLHRFIIGPSGTTLNALIGTGDERIVNVKFGSSAAPGAKTADSKNEDEVVVRGPSDEVKKVVKEIERIAEEAKNDEIVNSYTAEFDIEQRFVSHIVGKGGAGVQKLREELGVRIDFGDNAPAAGAAGTDGTSKVKKSSSAKKDAVKAHVKIQGRKENVEEAKKRILKQTDQLADETNLSVPLLAGLERGALIGKQGSYVQRLETKYDVRINFPRANAEDGERDDVITIRGGKKGAEGAKKELVELMEYEKEHSQVTTIQAPGRALARILGKQGAAIRELQDETKAEIDVSKSDPSNPGAPATITIKGTKQAIASAKKAISAIVSEIQDESTFEVHVERSLHNTIIGKGGQNIRDLITKCGGPSDSKAAGALVRFPRAGEDSTDTVVVRGPSALATKIKQELEKQAASLRDRVAYGVVVPQSAHARIIGRGGAGVNELQRKHDVKVVFPGRSEAKKKDELVNKDDLGEHADSDLIQIHGSQSAVEAAAEEIKSKAASAPSGSNAPRQPRAQNQQADAIVKTVSVPASLHTRIAQGGKFFRTLPNGIRIDHGDVKPPSSSNRAGGSQPNGAGKAARIDEEEDESDFHWEVTPLSDEQDNGEEIPWNIKGNDQAKVDRVEGMIQAALERSKAETHRGVLTVPQTLIPRIVGRQGSGLDKLRSYGVSAEVEGRQGANQVIFVGSPENLEKAREAVIELSQNRRGDRN